jgi:Mn2+/Fe2+ NRAMP family transporter
VGIRSGRILQRYLRLGVARFGDRTLSIDPIQALFWSAVINGFVAVPIVAGMMVVASRRDHIGRFTVSTSVRARRNSSRHDAAMLGANETLDADLTHIRQQNNKLMKLLKAKL